MDLSLEKITKVRFGLLYFDSYKAAKEWVTANYNDIMRNGGKYKDSDMQIKFSNGNVLILGYGDINKYLGCCFSFVHGCPELQHRVRE